MYEITDGEDFNWTVRYYPYREVSPQRNEKEIPQLEQTIFTHFFPNLRGSKKKRTQLVGNLSMYEMILSNIEFVMSSTHEPFLKTSEPFLRLYFKSPEPKFKNKLPTTFPVTLPSDNSPDQRTKSLFPSSYRELAELNKALDAEEISYKILLLGLEDGDGYGYTDHNIENIRRRINEESLRYKDNPNREYHFSRVNGSGLWKPISWSVREGDLDEILTRIEDKQ